jgi:hypothetical protein
MKVSIFEGDAVVLQLLFFYPVLTAAVVGAGF